MKNILVTIYFLFLLPCFSIAQADSMILIHDELGFDHVIENVTPIATKQQVITASRSLKSLKDLPFTIHVITKEEIRNNSYTTLVDVVKMLPGIRVSQPGSALEGETFMMRGLQGNAYTKILLNGNPIKPSVVRGMPIGAQLPIQQAERIEVIYGPAASLYGADASAGIINIILEKTERPVYAQANLKVGSKRFNNLDISFGGKLNKEKHTLHYSFFGSYTFLNDRRIYDNDALYDVDNYQQFQLDPRTQPNYVNADNDSPLFSTMPHESRMIGMNLTYRSLKLETGIISRSDHSSLGLSPTAVAYANPLNFIGERIVYSNLSVGNSYKKFSYQVKLSYLQYLMDNQSSTTYVHNTQSRSLEFASFAKASSDPSNFDVMLFDSLNDSHYERYFRGTRFSYAESHDLGLDLTFNFYPIKNVEVTVGGILQSFNSTPLVQFSKVPYDNAFQWKEDKTPINPFLVPFGKRKFDSGGISAFSQIYWTLRNFTFIGGLQYYFNSAAQFADEGNLAKFSSFNPRIASIISINKNLSLRAFYGEAFRVPPGFYFSSGYEINLSNVNEPLRKRSFSLRPEKTRTFELGTRWIPEKNIRADIVLFYSKTDSLISFSTQQESFIDPVTGETITRFQQGYRNSEFSEMYLYGLQSEILFRNLIPAWKVDLGINASLYYGEENIPDIGSRDDVREFPNFIAKARVIIHPSEFSTFTFDNIYMSSSDNRILSQNRPEKLDAFYTLDVIGNYRLSRNFTGVFRINNIFNKEYAGLNATGTDDDLLYNPQEKRTFRIGLTYRLN